jgi:hypothetical protein
MASLTKSAAGGGGPQHPGVWMQLDAIGQMFRHTLLQIGAALLPIGIYFAFDQGKEVLSMLGESLSLTSPALSSAILFLVGSVLAGFTIWWTARMMVEFDFGPTVAPAGRLGDVRLWLQKYWPRVLGVAPVLIVAAALFFRIFAYSDVGSRKAQWSLFWLGVWHLIGAGVLLLYFSARRKRVGKSLAKFRDFADRDQSSGESRIINLGLLLIAIITLLLVWAVPQVVAVALGTGAMFSLAAVGWLTIGTRLMFLRLKTGIPVVSILVCWVLLNSCWMDNHRFRLSSGEHPLQGGPTVKEAFTTWKKSLRNDASNSKPIKLRPVFIVATEGGGIRAAYWTASVLGSFQADSFSQTNVSKNDAPHSPDFASHLFAISGVSGGSVGSVVFDALLADQDRNIWQDAEDVLGRDHLAPLIGGLLFPDALQRALPLALPCTDRAAMLEKSWERAYLQKIKSDRLSQPFRKLFEASAAGAPGTHLPHLLLNGTMVETGQRVIFSDLAITAVRDGGEFLDAVDARALLFKKEGDSVKPWDIPLSTAGHASARFTYTNPAGLLSSGQRIVDGGYFENSGSVTALEVLRVIEEEISVSATSDERIVPVVIIISNDPQRQKDGEKVNWVSEDQVESQEKLKQPSIASNPVAKQAESQRETTEFKDTKPHQFASELLSPPRALMATRDARGTLALREIILHQSQAKQKLEAGGVSTPAVLISIHLLDEGIPLPLGWSLSHAAADDMQGQLWGDENLKQARASIREWLKLAAQP